MKFYKILLLKHESALHPPAPAGTPSLPSEMHLVAQAFGWWLAGLPSTLSCLLSGFVSSVLVKRPEVS